jgi:class 3 adenylate cyclase
LNPVLDSLRSRLTLRWLGHGLGLVAVFGLAWIDSAANRPWAAVPLGALCIALWEILFSLADSKTRKVKALAPGAFPFKNLPEGDRSLLQGLMMATPRSSLRRAGAAWVLGGLLMMGLGWRFGRAEFMAEAVFGILLGLPVAGIASYLGNAVLIRRVAPFYYFEGDAAEALAQQQPSLPWRLLGFILLPMAVLLPAPLAAALTQSAFTAWDWLWVLLWSGAAAFACQWALQELLVSPLEDLGMALERFAKGDYQALLDVCSGDALGLTTQRYNKAVRATDRRFFIRENFGHSLPASRDRELFEGGLKLDGEARDLAVLACSLLGSSQATLAQFNRFCQVLQDRVDAQGGSLEDLGAGHYVALFGAPLKLSDPVQAVARCAWELKAALEVLRSQQKMQSGVELAYGLGVAFGDLSVGLLGAKGRQRYGALGAALSEARNLSLRQGVWISASCQKHLGPEFECAPEGAFFSLVSGPKAPDT